MTSATYDEATNTLTMGFSQTLDLSTTTLRAFFTNNSSFQMKSNEFAAVALNTDDTLLTTSNNATVQVLLSTTHANNFEAVSSHTSPKVIVAASAFKNTNGDLNIKQDGSSTDYPAVTMTVAKDTTKPAVTSITYNESTKRLVLNFNVAVSKTFTNANVLFYYDKNTETAFPITGGSPAGLTANITPLEVTDATTLTFDLSTAHASNDFTELAADLKLAQQGGSTSTDPNTYNVYVKFAASTFTKSGSLLKNDAVTAKVAATTVTYTDNVGPYLTSTVNHTDISGSQTAPYNPDQVTVWFAYDEKVDKTAAETVANYKIWLMNGQTKQSALTINTATLVDYDTTKKIVKLITGTQTSGATYLLEVANVKDVSNNVISTTDTAKYSKTFTGSSSSAPKPYPVSAKIKDNGNQSLDASDYIAVTFDRPVKLNTSAVSAQIIGNNTGTNVNNFTLSTNFPNDYSKTNNLMMSTDTADADKVVWIKVDSTMVSTLTVGVATINFVGTGDGTQTLIQDKYSDAYAKAAGSAVTIESGLGATKITEALLTDVNTNGIIDLGDTLKVTFSNPLYVVSSTTPLQVTDFEIMDDKGSASAIASAFGTNAYVTTSMTNSVSATTLTVTFGTNPGLKPWHLNQVATSDVAGASATFNVATAKLKDSWGINLGKTGDALKYITTASVAAPYITNVEIVDVTGNGYGASDYLFVTFNVPVAKNAPVTKTMWKYNATNPDQDFSAVDFVTGSPNKLRLTINGISANTWVPTVTLFDVVAGTGAGAMASNITNYAGNPIVAATTTPKVAAASDATAPTITKVEFVNNVTLKVTFSEAVNIVAGWNNDFVLYAPPAFGVNNCTGPTLNTLDTTGKSIYVTVTGVSQSAQTNDITGSTTAGLKIADGQHIVDLAGNRLATYVTGANYVTVNKDATAPKLLSATVTATTLALAFDDVMDSASIDGGASGSPKAYIPNVTIKDQYGLGSTMILSTGDNSVATADLKTFTYTVNATDMTALLAKGAAALAVTAVDSTKIKDIAGNYITALTQATWVKPIADTTAPDIKTAVLQANSVRHAGTKGWATADGVAATGATLITALGYDSTIAAAGGDFVAGAIVATDVITIAGSKNGTAIATNNTLTVGAGTTVANLLTQIETAFGLTAGKATITGGQILIDGTANDAVITGFNLVVAPVRAFNAGNVAGSFDNGGKAVVRVTYTEAVTLPSTTATDSFTAAVNGTIDVAASTAAAVSSSTTVFDVKYSAAPTVTSGTIASKVAVLDTTGNASATTAITIATK